VTVKDYKLTLSIGIFDEYTMLNYLDIEAANPAVKNLRVIQGSVDGGGADGCPALDAFAGCRDDHHPLFQLTYRRQQLGQRNGAHRFSARQPGDIYCQPPLLRRHNLFCPEGPKRSRRMVPGLKQCILPLL